MTSAPREDQPQRYEIRLRGHLGQTFLSAFPDLLAHRSGGDTILTGELADQAALYGVIAEVEALGLELVEILRLSRRTPP
jgi:hypothetical protein